jgi:hypothetical protein
LFIEWSRLLAEHQYDHLSRGTFPRRYEATFGNEAGPISLACPIAGLMGTSTRIEHMPPGLDNGKDALAAVPV